MGITVWGAIFVGRGSERVAEIAAGDPAAAGDGARRLLEAASSGDVDPALANPTRAGFLAGLPKAPSSEKIFLNEQGYIEGLF